MKGLSLVLVLVLLTGCAGITLNTQHNEMFKYDEDADAQPVIKHGFAPSADALEGLSPEEVKEVLLAYAAAAARWNTYAPSWHQSIGSDIATEGDLQARLRFMLAKELQDMVDESTDNSNTGDGQ